MESGNSSSMQSSSGGGGGGEEEYDSRAADQSISAFFDHHNNHVSSIPTPQQNHRNLLHFDHNNNNSLIPPNYFNNNTFLPVNQQPDPISQLDLRTSSATSSLPPTNNIGVIKKTKKRSRASRRAPTTVLTTDTSNFRAMVQEFTGIPAPPLFNNNSIVNTTRLNTFLGLSSSSPNTYNTNNLLLRPFAQKLTPATPLLSGSQIQQYQNPNNGFEDMNLQALLQAHISNPRSNEHDQFGLGMMQTPSTNPPTTTAAANGNINTGDNGSYGGSDHEHNNDDKEAEIETKTQRRMAISTLTLTQSLYTRSFRPTIFFSSSSSSSFSCLCSSSSDCEPKLSVKKRVFGVGLGFLASSILSLTPLDADATRIDYYATVGDPLCEYSYAKSGLGFCDLDVGFGDEAPRGVLVNIHYTARFADGTLFDSSYKRARPLTMRIGVGKVIRGLDQGILGGEGVPPMRVGGKRKLQIPPKLAYGPEPAGCFSGDCNIPGNATLLYDINFVEIYPGSNTR